jgi:PAS domain S-box-containing protein
MPAEAGLVGAVFEGYPAPTLLVDGDVRVLLANRAARDLLGHGGEGHTALFRRGGDLLHCLHAEGPGGCGRQPECDDCVIRGAVGQAMRDAGVRRAQATMERRGPAGPREVRMLVSASAIEHQGDRRVVLTLEDVSDLVRLREEASQAEQALHQMEARLRTVVEGLHDGVVVIARDGELVHVNRAALAMHGFESLEECRRRLPEMEDLFELSTTEGRTLGAEEWPQRRILRGERLRDEEIQVRRRDTGWTRVWRYGGAPILDASGAPLLAAVTIADVTDRRRQEDALRESERQLSLVLEGSNDGFWDLDLPRRHYVFSGRCFEIIGDAPVAQAVPARFWWGRLHPDDVHVVRDALDAHLAGRTDRIDTEFRLAGTGGGWRWTRSVGRVVERDAAGRPTRLAGTLRDISERRAAQDRLRVALAENEKLVAELREALGKVKTLSGLLPICAWCKRIRDDQGYWALLEAYLSRHSDATFSHSMCPECYQRMAGGA